MVWQNIVHLVSTFEGFLSALEEPITQHIGLDHMGDMNSLGALLILESLIDFAIHETEAVSPVCAPNAREQTEFDPEGVEAFFAAITPSLCSMLLMSLANHPLVKEVIKEKRINVFKPLRSS